MKWNLLARLECYVKPQRHVHCVEIVSVALLTKITMMTMTMVQMMVQERSSMIARNHYYSLIATTVKIIAIDGKCGQNREAQS